MKRKIFSILEAERGKFVSGEEIAEALGISRAAVWKSIELLRKEGHKIKAVTNKGYMLEKFSDVLTAEGIKEKLSADTKVSQVICLDETDSTNNYAKKLALNGAVHGTLITANRQTAGRGRHGHTFESPAGTGLYMSIILRPDTDAGSFQMITVADAVAVCLALEELCPSLKGSLGIKWVNDVFFKGRKITGILTEAVTGIESGEIESIVTGIGINISTTKFGTEASKIAGAVFPDGNISFTRNELCAKTADYIMTFAENLNDKSIINAYRERSILTGHDITYLRGSEKCYGRAEGIDDTGGLIVRNESGEIETLRSGEVFTVRSKEVKS